MEVAEKSLINGRLFGLQLPGVDVERDPKRLPEVGEAIRKNWQWSTCCIIGFGELRLTCGIAWTTVLDDDVKEAVRLLEAGDSEGVVRARM
jgi:salicylate hydroxylase